MFGDERSQALLDQTLYAQPALFTLEAALARLIQSWGIQPQAVIGHSVGEYVAAIVAGALDLEDALALIARRARLMQSLPPGGAMASVTASEERVRKLLGELEEPVSVAAVNGPRSTVLSGPRDALVRTCEELRAHGVRSHELRVSHAFHSPLMDPILDQLEDDHRRVQHHPLALPLACNVEGQVLPAGRVIDASRWRLQASGTIRFQSGVCSLLAQGFDTFIELGPQPVLTALGERCDSQQRARWLATLSPQGGEQAAIFTTLAELHVAGTEIDWRAVDQGRRRSIVSLPTYPFQRQRYWIDTPGDHLINGCTD